MLSRLLLPAALALGAVVAACGPSQTERVTAAQLCPKALRVQDAASLTRFKPGRGRDATDTLVQASLSDIAVTCGTRRERVDVDIAFEVRVAEGPALAKATPDRKVALEYFVAIIDPQHQILTRRTFNADFQFTGNRTKLQSKEELSQRIPLSSPNTGGGYQIAVGFVMTPDEVEFNRRGTARR
ncbi:MAG: hypothetical protein JO055_01720 [Alphaproteobacteria bacterium]|nr:hypothetical protein [Alphaproteobacteria bacterium]